MEEEQFVELLSVYGSDFSVIAKVMGKTRAQIRRKFKYLEKKKPKAVEVIFEDK